MFYIIIGSVTFIAFILLVIVIFYNKYQFNIIKVEKAESNIKINLNRKLEFIRQTIPIIKKELKLKEFLNEADEINEEILNSFELNKSLTELSKKLFNVIDDNDKLYRSKPLVDILTEYNKNEVDLVAAIKFYNDTVVDYNHLIVSFPSNFIRHIFKYKKLDFYTHEKRETFEILKEEKEEKK